MSDYDRPRAMADAVVEQATANPGEKRTTTVNVEGLPITCQICAALVKDSAKHQAWHDA